MTFVQSSKSADTYLNQASNQLGTANSLLGNLGVAAAQANVSRSTSLLAQVNNFLGLASASNSRARGYISNMATQAVGPEEQRTVVVYTNRSDAIQNGIVQAKTQASGYAETISNIEYRQGIGDVVDAGVTGGAQTAGLNRPRGTLNQDDALATDISGVIVAEDAKAYTEGASTQDFNEPLQTFNDDGELVSAERDYSLESNADEPELLNNDEIGLTDSGSTVGGNRSIRSTEQTQPGATSPKDDTVDFRASTVGYSTGTFGQQAGRPAISQEFLQRIVAQSNPLSSLASMSYTISIYLMNIEEYRQLLISQRKVLPTQQLLVQSGGIDKQSKVAGLGQRNKWFDVDFYIDDLWIQSLVGTQSGAKAHNSTQLVFSIFEPQGITFLNRLRNAVRDHVRVTGKNISELSQNFLMVIRFYGYDENGNLINGSQLGSREIGSDPTAITEKWIPFQLADIRYQIANKVTEYKITATIPQTNVAFSNVAGTIPFNFELNAPDIHTLLFGKAQSVKNIVSAAQARTDFAATDPRRVDNPSKASALSQLKTYNQGLCDALNEHQQELKAKGKIDIADQYEIQIDNIPGLIDAKIAKQGKQDKARAPMNLSENARDQLLMRASKYDKETKTWSIQAGTQIVQLIDLIIRNSTYITSQQNIIFDEKTGEPKAQSPVSTVQWFRIRSRVEPLGYDAKRNNIAYKIIYIISPYQINDPKSVYFPQAAYRGAHKIYNYWFTGQNTEVVDFNITVNANFLTTFGTDAPIAPNYSSGRWFEKRAFQTAPNEALQGGVNNSSLPAANLSERLYSTVDIQTAQVTILGDPDWIQQSEVFYNKTIDLSPFLRDGSVNYDASEVLYEMRFNPVTDYNLENGLSETFGNNTAYSPITNEKNLPQESAVYAAAVVDSYFKQGKFTQKLTGTLREFDRAFGSSRAQGFVLPSTSARDYKVFAPTDKNYGAFGEPPTGIQNQTRSIATTNSTKTIPWEDPYGTSLPSTIYDSADQDGNYNTNISSSTPLEGTDVVSDDAYNADVAYYNSGLDEA